MKSAVYKLVLFFTISMFLSFNAYSQGSTSKQNDNNPAKNSQMKAADELFDQFAYMEAIPIYERLVIDGKGDDHTFKRLADSYRLINNSEQAEYWYSIVVESEKVEPIDYYYYAQALKSNSKYSDAEVWMKKYTDLNSSDTRATRELSAGNYVKVLMADSNSFEVNNLSINTEYPDFAPAFYKNKIIFASGRNVNSGIYKWNNKPYLDLYIANKTATNDLTNPISFSNELNSKYHEGAVTFNKTGNIIYFTRNNLSEGKLNIGKDQTNNLKVYKAMLVGEVWGNVESLHFNSDDYSSGHPSLSSDGSKLYFASNMPGGKGGTDIYVCNREGSSWGQPVNMGETINTEGDELFPYIHEDGKLYFSSDGLVGIGALDVFMALPDGNGGFAQIINLGAPINSAKDDFALIMAADGKTGFFSSDRPGGVGDDDIYSFRNLDEEWFTRKKTTPDNNLTDNTTGDKNNNLDPTADLDLTKDDGKKIPANPVYDFSVLDTIKPSVGQKFVINNIYYDLDKSNIRPDAAVELDKVLTFLNKFPNVIIELSSHTDCRASDSYNDKLSQRRAVSATKYLVDRGINTKRIFAKGYGEHNLVNRCADGIECSEAEHQQNRRTEITVLGM